MIDMDISLTIQELEAIEAGKKHISASLEEDQNRWMSTEYANAYFQAMMGTLVSVTYTKLGHDQTLDILQQMFSVLDLVGSLTKLHEASPSSCG